MRGKERERRRRCGKRKERRRRYKARRTEGWCSDVRSTCELSVKRDGRGERIISRGFEVIGCRGNVSVIYLYQKLDMDFISSTISAALTDPISRTVGKDRNEQERVYWVSAAHLPLGSTSNQSKLLVYQSGNSSTF